MTTQTLSSVDLDARTVTRTVRIAAGPDAVWRALTEPEHVAGWFGDTCETDDGGPFTLGSRGRFHFGGHGWSAFQVTRLDAPRELAFRWAAPEVEDGTEAVFTLAPDGEGTRLTVVETGFDRADDATAQSALEDHRQGWNSELDELVAYVESRQW